MISILLCLFIILSFKFLNPFKVDYLCLFHTKRKARIVVCKRLWVRQCCGLKPSSTTNWLYDLGKVVEPMTQFHRTQWRLGVLPLKDYQEQLEGVNTEVFVRAPWSATPLGPGHPKQMPLNSNTGSLLTREHLQ